METYIAVLASRCFPLRDTFVFVYAIVIIIIIIIINAIIIIIIALTRLAAARGEPPGPL